MDDDDGDGVGVVVSGVGVSDVGTRLSPGSILTLRVRMIPCRVASVESDVYFLIHCDCSVLLRYPPITISPIPVGNWAPSAAAGILALFFAPPGSDTSMFFDPAGPE